MEKLVSIIIPAYNHEKYIKDCIESVLNQTYKNIEVIVEDDCSTDNTKKEIKKIKDKRLKTIFSTKNKGTVYTMNDLMEKAKGDYIAILGSDDMWYPTKIEKQMKIFESNKDIGCVFTDTDAIDEKGKKYKPEELDINKIFPKENMNQEERIRLFYERGNHLCHPSSLISKKVIKEIGLYNPTYRQLHDYDYWTRLILKYNIYIIDETLMAYRREREKNNSVSASNLTNNIRLFNEMFNINYNMIKNMSDELLIKTFKDKFKNKDSNTKIELECERYFIIRDMKCGNSNNRIQAYNYIFNKENIFEILETLKNSFRYSINDFYKDTGIISENYPRDILINNLESLKSMEQELNNYKNMYLQKNQEVEDLKKSISWRITKPLRKIRGMIK